MSVDFFEGTMDGRHLSPINENEIKSLGYRVAIRSKPKGQELIHCIAVPLSLDTEEVQKIIKNRLRPNHKPDQGKKSL